MSMEVYRLIQIEEDQEDFEEEEDYEEGEDGEFVDEDEVDNEDEEMEESIPVEMTLPTVTTSIADGRTSQGAAVNNDGLLDDSNSSEGKPGKKENGGGDGGKEEMNRCEIDGLICPICFEAWTSGGEHQICCLPCGHIYGLSCIKKWLQRSPSSRKCPQCKGLCKLKDVRVLYAARLCVADEELHKRVLSLEAECAYLKQKAADAKAADIEAKLQKLEERMDATNAKFDAMKKVITEMQNMRGN